MLFLIALLVVSQNLFAIRSDLAVFMGMYEDERHEEVASHRWLIQQPACSNAECCACGAVTCICGAGACLGSYFAMQGSFIEGVMITALCCLGGYNAVGERVGDIYLGKKRT